tara:strand:+ start:2705 stop:3256 length:552 start_codon:yes stop_codon:yes gene_type:complete
MACICGNLIVDGIEVLCDNNAGGVLRILVTDACNLQSPNPYTETVEGIIDGINLELGSQFFEINTQRLTASLEENETNVIETGSKYFDQILNLVVARRDVARRNSISTLGAGQKDLVFLVQDSNKIWWAVGINEGVKLFTDASGTGTKKEELNGYTIQFTGQDSIMMSTVDGTIIPSLEVPAV